MQIEPFALERYFARHEFSARFLLSSSDCEALRLDELVAMAGPDSRRLWDELRLAYTESPGHPLLRTAIAGLYAGFTADDVLTVVPEEGIFLLMHALLEPGDHVVCVAPAYQSLYEVARSIGCEVTRWTPDEDRGWCFDPADLERLLRPDTRLVVVNFPHNPTGAAPDAATFRTIVEVVTRHGARLLSDEMYRFLEVVPGSTLPAGCELADRAVTLGGLSKSFGLPGLRTGWVVTRDHALLGRMCLLKDYTTICAAAPSEVLAIVALENRDAILAIQHRRVHRNLFALRAFLDRHQTRFRWNPPVGGSVCLPRYLGPENTRTLCDEAVERAGIMLLPSAVFDFGDRHVRIGFGRENLPEVLERFDDFLAAR